MPKKIKGKHQLHVKVTTGNFRTLQAYCNGGIERISASEILELFMEHYISHYLNPRMGMGQTATYRDLEHDLPRITALVAHLIEPGAFPNPNLDPEPHQ